MSIDAKKTNQLVIPYRLLQRLLGFLGLTLPAAHLIFTLVDGRALEPSISHFYYAKMGGLLVGTLSAGGVFLLCYDGYPDERPKPGLMQHLWTDRIFSLLAGFGAIGVAIFSVHTDNLSPPLVLDEVSKIATPVYFGFLEVGDKPHYLGGALLCLHHDPGGVLLPARRGEVDQAQEDL